MPPRMTTARDFKPAAVGFKGSRLSVCLDCGEMINLVALHQARAQKAEYRHSCGRVLWKANG